MTINSLPSGELLIGFLSLWLGLASMLTSCGSDSSKRDSPGEVIRPEAYLDPQTLKLDAGFPFTTFDGDSGSILPGPGWAPPETEDTGRTFAWVVGNRASFWVVPPEGTLLDLWAECRPYTYPSAPPQTISVIHQGSELARGRLEDDWHTIRLPLGHAPLEPRLQELELRFANAERPREVEEGNSDDRKLAAACRTLAIVPRATTDVPALLDGPNFDPASGELRLIAGARVTLPLPAGHRIRLRMADASSACSSCLLSVGLRAEGNLRELFRGPAAEAGGLVLELVTPSGSVPLLVLHFADRDQAAPDHRKSITVGLPVDFVEMLAPTAPNTRPEDAWETTEPAAARPPDIFIYLVDTLRHDMSEDPSVSPAMVAFARDAVSYRQTWSASSWTLPSVVSILTGVYPHQHGIVSGTYRFDGNPFPPLAQRLSAAGYETIGISQSLVASPFFGIDQGFDRFFYNNQLGGFELRSQRLRGFLLAVLHHRRSPGAPVFAYLHGVGPHSPYAPRGADRRFLADPGSDPDSDRRYLPHLFFRDPRSQDPDEIAHLRGLYLGEVAYSDRQFGRFIDLLRHLGLYDRSLVVLLSDHGEEFGEHGGFEHGRTPFEEMIRVPMMIKFPRGTGGGQVVETRVSTIDIVPTLMARADHPSNAEPDLLGTDLLPQETASTGRRLVLSEVNPNPSKLLSSVNYRSFGLRQLKCIESLDRRDQLGNEIPALRAFDLAMDPDEQTPLAEETSESGRCRRISEQWRQALEARHRAAEGEAAGDAALEELRALGYIN